MSTSDLHELQRLAIERTMADQADVASVSSCQHHSCGAVPIMDRATVEPAAVDG